MEYLVLAMLILAALFFLVWKRQDPPQKRALLVLPVGKEALFVEGRLRQARRSLVRAGLQGALFLLDVGADPETALICRRYLDRYGGQMGTLDLLQRLLQEEKRFARGEKV